MEPRKLTAEEGECARERGHMVEDDAEDFALHGVNGGDIDGLVVSPAHECEGESDVSADC